MQRAMTSSGCEMDAWACSPHAVDQSLFCVHASHCFAIFFCLFRQLTTLAKLVKVICLCQMAVSSSLMLVFRRFVSVFLHVCACSLVCVVLPVLSFATHVPRPIPASPTSRSLKHPLVTAEQPNRRMCVHSLLSDVFVIRGENTLCSSSSMGKWIFSQSFTVFW